MALSTDKIIEECSDLIRFDQDAIGAYDEAIDKISDTEIVSKLTEFRGDHQRHVTDLGAIVKRLGGTPPAMPGARGLFRKTLTKIAGLVGTEACLRAMERNEGALNEQYSKRIVLDLPADILAVIRKNYDDERRHLAWVQEALRTRLWERPATIQP